MPELPTEREGQARELASLREMLQEHVTYEIEMLIRTFALLEAGVPDQRLVNALIESFSVHARILCDFFSSAKRTYETDAKSIDFVDEGYISFANGVPRKALTDKFDKQIAHVSYSRIGAEKIGQEDRREVFLVLAAEIQNFARHLKPELRASYLCLGEALKSRSRISRRPREPEEQKARCSRRNTRFGGPERLVEEWLRA